MAEVGGNDGVTVKGSRSVEAMGPIEQFGERAGSRAVIDGQFRSAIAGKVADGELVSLVETHGIGRRDDGSITSTDPEGVLADDAVASMNCWVFPNSLMAHLEAGFETFLAEHGDEEKTEYLLPTVVNELMAAGAYTVGVVPTAEPWVGVTNPDDLEIARRRIRDVRA